MTRTILSTAALAALTLALIGPSASAAEGTVLEGTNVFGRTGLLLSDTARTPEKGKALLSAHALVGADGNFTRLHLPVGVCYGLEKNLEVSADLQLLWINLDAPVANDKRAGVDRVSFGGKFLLPTQGPVRAALGADVFHGPFLDDLGKAATGLSLRGIAGRTLGNGILVNGEAGLLFSGDRGTGSVEAAQAAASAAYPLSPSVTGMVELALNRFTEGDGLVAVGVRAGGETPFQALLGFGIGDDAPDVTLGAGVSFGP